MNINKYNSSFKCIKSKSCIVQNVEGGGGADPPPPLSGLTLQTHVDNALAVPLAPLPAPQFHIWADKVPVVARLRVEHKVVGKQLMRFLEPLQVAR